MTVCSVYFCTILFYLVSFWIFCYLVRCRVNLVKSVELQTKLKSRKKKYADTHSFKTTPTRPSSIQPSIPLLWLHRRLLWGHILSRGSSELVSLLVPGLTSAQRNDARPTVMNAERRKTALLLCKPSRSLVLGGLLSVQVDGSASGAGCASLQVENRERERDGRTLLVQ